MSNTVQEYRLALSRLLWAPPLANAAALIATLQLLGSVEDPDYVFGALKYPIALLGIGAALGMVGIVMGLLSLLSDLAVENVQLLREAFADSKHPGRGWDEYIDRDIRRSHWRETAAVWIAGLSIACLISAGTWAYVSARQGRLQPPPESRAPDRLLDAITLLNDYLKDQPARTSKPDAPPSGNIDP